MFKHNRYFVLVCISVLIFLSISISPIVSGKYENLKDTQNDVKPFRLQGVRGVIEHLEFSPDNQLLVSATDIANTISVWSLAQKKKVKEVKIAQRIMKVAFSGDNQSVLFCLGNGKIGDFNIKAGKVTYWKGINNHPVTFALNAARDKMLVGYRNAVEVRNLKTGRQEVSLPMPKANIMCVNWAMDDSHCVIATVGGSVSLWNIKTKMLVKQFGDNSLPEDSFPKSIYLVSENKEICCCFVVDYVLHWDSMTGELIGKIKKGKVGVRFLCSCYDAKHNTLLVSKDYEETLKFVDLTKRKQTNVLPLHHRASSVAISSNSKRIAVGYGSHYLGVTDEVNSGIIDVFPRP